MIPHLSHGSRIDRARVDLKRGFCFACRRGRSPKACKRLERRSIMGAVRATCAPRRTRRAESDPGIPIVLSQWERGHILADIVLEIHL